MSGNVKIKLVVQAGADSHAVANTIKHLGEMVEAVRDGEDDVEGSLWVLNPVHGDQTRRDFGFSHTVHAMWQEDSYATFTEHWHFTPEGVMLTSEADEDF